jgi:hypothetical protein
MSVRKRGQRGRAQATLDLIDTCIKIIEPCQPISVRGVCYKLFVAGLIDSMAGKNTQKISRILTDAREEGLIPWEWIVDESRQLERQPRWSNLEAYAAVIERAYRRDFWADQNSCVVVMSEKSTVAGVLRPTLHQYGVPFFACHGFNSATKVHELAEQIINDSRHYIFLYVGDYDPSGLWMSEKDLSNRLFKYGAGWPHYEYEYAKYHLDRVALTSEDTEDLPSFSALSKNKDPRYEWYVDSYGDDCWELDAMDPATLRDRVESYIKDEIDPDAWERHLVIEAAQRQSTKMVAAQLAAMNAEGA